MAILEISADGRENFKLLDRTSVGLTVARGINNASEVIPIFPFIHTFPSLCLDFSLYRTASAVWGVIRRLTLTSLHQAYIQNNY